MSLGFERLIKIDVAVTRKKKLQKIQLVVSLEYSFFF